MAVAGMTVRVKMPSHAALMLYGGTHRLALGVKLHVLGVFLGHRNQSLVLIKLGGRVCLDLGDDALEVPPAPHDEMSVIPRRQT